MWVRSSKLTVHFPPPKTCTDMRLRMRSTPVMVPPTSVVVVWGTGAGSRIGSWPSVVSAPEVAELSSISGLGCAGGGGGAMAGADCWAFDFCWSVAVGTAVPAPGFAGALDGCWFPVEGKVEGDAEGAVTVAPDLVSVGVGAALGVAGVPEFGVCGSPEPCFGSAGDGLAWAQLSATDS